MELHTKFSALTNADIQSLSQDLKGIISDGEIENFKEYTSPYERLSYRQLDNIYLVAEVTITGNGQVQNLMPHCTLNQVGWWNYAAEPDMQIDDVIIPFKMLIPQSQFLVSGSHTFLTVLQAEGNIWDSCKDLPQWVWDDGEFEFMLSFSMSVDVVQNYCVERASTNIRFK